jgi:argininosuccinate lyase
MSISAKLGSGYQRDMQRIKAPLFRAIDTATESGEIMRHLIGSIRFIPENIRLDPAVYAAGHANRLVLEEGISFRDAYRRVARDLNSDD